MKLIELINNLKATESVIEVVDANEDFGTYKFYTVYWLTQDIVKSEPVCIHIHARNTEQESAYYKNSKPTVILTAPTNTFKSMVQSKIDTYVANNINIEAVKIVSCDEQSKIAELDIYDYNTAIQEVSKRTMMAYMTDSTIKIRILT